MAKNNVRAIRESLLMSKAELARKAGLSALTIDRVEKGMDCRMDTKRKIILALGFKLTEKSRVFGDDSAKRSRKGSRKKGSKKKNPEAGMMRH